MTKRARTSFTLDPQMIDDLRYCAHRMGVSSSAIVSSFLADPLADMRKMLEALPPSPTEEDIRRFSGESMRVVEERIQNLRSLSGDMFGQ